MGNGIPGNASVATKLQYLTFANAKNIRRGMHFFYTGFGLIKAGEQDYFSLPAKIDPQEVFAADPDPADPKQKRKLQELTPVANVPVITDLDALLDAEDPSNKAAAALNAKLNDAHQKAVAAAKAANKTLPPRPSLVPLVVIAPEKAFAGARLIAASLIGNSAGQKDPADCLVRCEKEGDGKVRLHACKWTHQEIVLDVKVSPSSIQVFMFSTAGGPSGDDGTGIRKYDLPPTKEGRETRSLNILFGFMQAVPSERLDILDACFVNPGALKIS